MRKVLIIGLLWCFCASALAAPSAVTSHVVAHSSRISLVFLQGHSFLLYLMAAFIVVVQCVLVVLTLMRRGADNAVEGVTFYQQSAWAEFVWTMIPVLITVLLLLALLWGSYKA